METKLTKEELTEKINSLEKQKNELDDELFYQKYSNLTFFSIWKKTTNWESIIIIFVLCTLVPLLGKSIELLYIICIPMLFILASLSNTLEIKQRIYIIKKKMK